MDEKIKSYIETKLLNDQIRIGYDTALYSDGLLSSMAHLKLIHFIERTFRVSIPSQKINLDNFNSLGQICVFIKNLGEKELVNG